jgi:tetratricopeptide (TPR) repeat protein
LRNEEKFVEAKEAFADTVKMLAGIDAGWTQEARKAESELLDPNVYYLPKMRKHLAAGDAKAALSEANVALKAIPNNARLHAERGLIHIELIRGQGPKVAEAAQEAIKADATAAAKDKTFVAESAYIVGLLEEELAHWAEAEKLYRDAIKMHEDSNEAPNAGGKYRVALARVLLRDRTEAADVPVPNPNDKDEKKKDGARGRGWRPDLDGEQSDAKPRFPHDEFRPGQTTGASLRVVHSTVTSSAPATTVNERTIVVHPWSLLVAAQVVAQEPVPDPEDPEAIARYKEAVDQAKKLIASDDKDLKGAGYLALGKALSKLGQRTEGLKAYSEGMRLLNPGMTTKDLKDLIDQHPAFKQPDSEGPNPLMAERHFGEGMHHYWAKKYVEAEAQFRQAVKYFDKDARYWYFMGLAQIQQKTVPSRHDAIYSFQKGATLEAQSAQSNPDAVREINTSLERIQGELRQQLNNYRYKAMAGEPEGKKKAPQTDN